MPRRLVRAFDAGRVVLFAGAGISKQGPSFLPDWLEFNESLLHEAKASALRGLPGLGAGAVEALDGLTLERIPIESFSDLVVRGFASEGYFSVLDVLDSEHPNVNHRAIAALADRGHLRAVVTTNFDTLIECSFRRAGLSATTIVTEDDYRTRRHARGCPIYKIHGSVRAGASLVDTVTQKLRGLAPHVRTRLSKLFATHHVLVLGYSGADLRFDADYLVFSAIGPQSPGLTWVTLPGFAPLPAVRQLIGRLGSKATLVEASLPAFFERLGIRVTRVLPAADADAQRAANRCARERIRRFYDEGYVGPFTSAAFCANVLSRAGDHDGARALRVGLRAEVERWGDRVPRTAGAVFRTLAIGAMDDGDLVAAERWSGRELAFWVTVKEALDARPEGDAHALAEWTRNCAAAWSNVSRVRMAQGDFESARQALDQAVSLGVTTRHAALTALMLKDRALLAIESDEPDDVAIDYLRRSAVAALQDGAVDALVDTTHRVARILISLAEYDVALAELESVERIVQLTARAATQIATRALHAEIAIRRGSVDAGSRMFVSCLDDAPPDSPLGARLRYDFARFVGFEGALRARALHGIDEVLHAMRDGRLPDSGLQGVPLAATFEGVAAAMFDVRLPRLPLVMIDRMRADPELAIRQRIALCEFAGFRDALPGLFAALCARKRSEDAPRRLLDLARALVWTSQRAGDPVRRLEGVNYAAIAAALLGDRGLAMTEYEHALAADVPATDVREVLAGNLCVLRAAGEGDPTKVAAKTLSVWRSRGVEPHAAARAAWPLAEVFLAQHDFAAAIGVLRQGAAAAEIAGQARDGPPGTRQQILHAVLDGLRLSSEQPNRDQHG